MLIMPYLMPTADSTPVRNSLVFIGQSGAGPTRGLDALLIAINQADSSGWYSSTLQLQLTSLQFCELCRRVPTLHLTVETAMHDLVWKDYDTRVPTLRPLILTWRRPFFYLNVFSRKALARLQQLKFEGYFEEETENIVWLLSLQKLTFGNRFNQTIDRVAWPT